MNTVPEIRWYCLRARVKREHFAAKQLAERTGVEAFAPRLAVRHARRTGEALVTVEALFPGYIFARFRFPDDLRFVTSTPDVTGIVQFGTHTPPVADDLIEFLRAQVASAHTTSPLLSSGDWVEVLAGCLAGSEGRVMCFDNARARAWVLLSLLGQDLRISLPATALRRAGPAHQEFPPQLLAGCA